MLHTFLVAAALAQTLAPQPAASDAPSAVRLLFQAGDLRRAVNMAMACAGSKKKGFKECAAMVKPLVEYQDLIGKDAAMTAEDARALLENEQKISPQVPGKLSAEVVGRFVTHPWEQAVAAERSGDLELAQKLARQVLAVSPRHEGALAIAGPADAGRADGGHPRPSKR